MYYGDYWSSFGGGSYSSVYVPPSISVFPVVLMVCMVCIPAFFFFTFLLCFVYLFLDSHMPLVVLLCVFYPCLDENFWGVYAYAFYHMQLYVCFEICILNIPHYI